MKKLSVMCVLAVLLGCLSKDGGGSHEEPGSFGAPGSSGGTGGNNPPGSVPPSDNRIAWNGANWYLQGVNLPWYNWQLDFGGGTSGGVSSSSVQSALASRFSQLKSIGVHVVRWWVFPGNPWQIQTTNGTPSGMNPAIYPDFDAALSLAATYDLYYVFVLFSGPMAIPTDWMTDSGKRASLASVLGTLFAKYKDHPRVLTWEVFNEPEWDIWNGAIALQPVKDTVSAIASAVHANCNAYVTVGSAMLDGLPMWKGTGLDYYQAHWYDYMNGGDWDAFDRTYADVKAQYGLDRPVVIGELYCGPDVDPKNRLEKFYANGYAGAWPWSLFPEKTGDGMTIDLGAMGSFVSGHSDIGPK